MSQSKVVVLSDIHANLSALNAVVDHFTQNYKADGIILLGDTLNYGMRPNETILRIEDLASRIPIICALRGNHDDAMLSPKKHLSHFSTDRGRDALIVMSDMLDEHSRLFIENYLNNEGKVAFMAGGKNILCVHGDIQNAMWGKMESTRDEAYSEFDYVLSGHSHKPHLKEEFFVHNNPEFRDKRKTVFINPGSVGQPRNHNPKAQYVYLDVENQIMHFNAVAYDIEYEMSLYTQQIDPFYSKRLKNGI